MVVISTHASLREERRYWSPDRVGEWMQYAATQIPHSSHRYFNGPGVDRRLIGQFVSAIIDTVQGPAMVAGRAMVTDQLLDDIVTNDVLPAMHPETGEVIWWRGALVLRIFNHDTPAGRFPANELHIMGFQDGIDGNLDTMIRYVDTTLAP